MDDNKDKKIDELLKTPTKADPRRQRVYGVYDNSRASLTDRIDDFLIDHTRISLQEKAYFFHLLAVMIDAGVPLITAMNILAARTQSVRFARILFTIAYSLKQGSTLSASASRFVGVFSEIEIGVIRAGEAAGNLDRMLLKLSEQLDKSNALQIKLITAAIYPLAVLGVLIIAATGMMIFVVPSLVGMLLEGGLKQEEIPFLTKALLAISSFTINYWWAVIIIILVIYFLVKIWAESEAGKYRWDIMKLKFPVVGDLLRKVYVLRFVSTLGILIDSGLPVIKSLEIVAQSMSSELYALKIWEVIARVKNGQRISESLMDSPFLFPETVTQMLSVGEQTGSVGKIAQKIGDHYDQEIDNSLKRLTSLFEPVMIVIVGVTVALLALAILSPVFKLTSLVK